MHPNDPDNVWPPGEEDAELVAEREALNEAHAAPCENCGGSGVEMFVGFENSVGERPCSYCFPDPDCGFDPDATCLQVRS